jgi:hypothetical protein
LGDPASDLLFRCRADSVLAQDIPDRCLRDRTDGRLGIVQKNSRPGHPTTCGKVERFQQTMKRWLRAQPGQPTTIAGLQALLDRFTVEYNQRRPHRSLPHRATPATAYTARPKATPSADRARDTHDRVRTDRIDSTGCVTLRVNGRLHHIGIERTHAQTHVLLLVQDLPCPRRRRRQR